MPEIAEVETVRRTLRNKIVNKKIIKVNLIYDKTISTDKKEFQENILNQSIVDILRRGKWLIFELDDYYLLSHLRMEGKYFLKDSNDEIVKHEHVIFSLNDGSDLRYHDTRKFGRMLLAKKELIKEINELNKQGYEPNDDNLTAEYLLAKFKNKTLPIKSILLDQTIISGLGNIYANEVLFQAKINPLKKGKDLTKRDCQKIINASNQIIAKAIEMGGTTIKSYTSSLGVTGNFQQYLKVHKRDKEPCYQCGTLIKNIKVNGRSTYYCEKCQK